MTRAATLLRVLGVIELPATSGSERLSGQKVVGKIPSAGALPGPALIDALFSASDHQLRGALAHGVQALRDARGDAPSLPQPRGFALSQTADTGPLFRQRLAAWYGLSTGGAAALGDHGPQRTRACATGILGSATQGACPICHMRVGDARELLELAARDRGAAPTVPCRPAASIWRRKARR